MPPPLTERHDAKPLLGMAALPLTTVVGATDFFCGLAKTGGIHCWGRRSDFLWGKFKDFAMTDDALCAVTTSGAVRCYRVGKEDKWQWEEKSSTPVQDARRVSGAGSNFCSLSTSGTVTCWTGPGGSPLVPPDGVRAEFFDVGEKFACLADSERKLHCFGETGALQLPEVPSTVKDLAVGEDFVCVVDATEAVRCFGKKFDFEGKQAKAVSAHFGTACARSAKGQTTCQGTLRATFVGAMRIGVGSNDICVVNEQGRLACQGKAGSWEASAPPEYLPALQGSGSKDELQEFLRLFRRVELPLTFGQGGDNAMGEPLPKKFGKLLGESAAKYWTGVRFELAGGYQAVTLVDPSLPRIELHVFSASGKHVHRRVVAHLQTRDTHKSWSAGEGYLKRFSGKSTHAVVKEDSTIVTESSVLLEVERSDGYIQPEKLCSILAFESVDAWKAEGKFTSQKSHIKQLKDASDKNGCGDESPFERLDMRDNTARKILQKWKDLRIKETASRGESVEISVPMDQVYGFGDHYTAVAFERIEGASSCQRWEYVVRGSSQEGWSPKIERRYGPACCPEAPCPHQNQPFALHLAVVEAPDAGALSKWIHPSKGCKVTIVDDGHAAEPYVREGTLTPGDSRIVSGELALSPHDHVGTLQCDEEFKDGIASCHWGTGGAHWTAQWEMIEGKPYLTRYEFSGH